MRFLWWYFGSDLSPQSFCVSGQSTVRVGVQGDWWRSSSIKRVTIPQCRRKQPGSSVFCSDMAASILAWSFQKWNVTWVSWLLAPPNLHEKKKKIRSSFLLSPSIVLFSISLLPVASCRKFQAGYDWTLPFKGLARIHWETSGVEGSLQSKGGQI